MGLKNKKIFWMAWFVPAGAAAYLISSAFRFSSTAAAGLALGVSVAAVNAILCFLSLEWAFAKSNRVFFGTFVGGVFWKFSALGAVTYWLFNDPTFHPAATLLSLALATLVGNIFEVVWIKERAQ